MRTVLRAVLCASILTAAALGQESPRMKSVEPDSGKVGAEVTISGENLDAKFVKEVYLTDGKTDIKLDVTGQAADAIKAKVPAKVKPGRYSLMVLTAEKTPKLIEQPVKFTVQE
jgi:hypothetical protein